MPPPLLPFINQTILSGNDPNAFPFFQKMMPIHIMFAPHAIPINLSRDIGEEKEKEVRKRCTDEKRKELKAQRKASVNE
jgi:hypothetical protein